MIDCLLPVQNYIRNLLRKTDLALLILALLPWLLLLPSDDWFFRLGDMDTSIHLGYMLNFDSGLSVFNAANYQQSRLPWLFPGYLAYHWLPPVIATYVLHLGFYYAALFSLYLSLKYTINQRAALLAAILLGTYPWFLEAMTTAYWHGAGVAYILLAIFLLTSAGRFRYWKTALWGAGMSVVALMWVNMAYLIVAPVFVLYYLYANQGGKRNPLFTSLLTVAVGAVTMTLILGMINFAYGYPFLSVLHAVNYAFNFAVAYQMPVYYLSQRLEALKTAVWLILPTLIVLSGLLFLLLNRANQTTRSERFALFSQWLNIGVVALFAMASLKMISLVSYFEYASILIPTMFLALGAQMNSVLSLPRGQFRWLVGGTIIAVVVSFHRALLFHQVLPPVLAANVLWLLVPIIAIWLLDLGVFLRRPPIRVLGLGVFVAGIVLVSSLSAPPQGSRDGFLAIVKGAQSVRQMPSFFNQADPLFWVNRTDGVSYALANVFLSTEKRMVNPFPVEDWQSPQFLGDPPLTLRPTAGSIVAIVSKDSRALEKAIYSLNKINLTARLAEEKVIEQGSLRYYVTFISVDNQPFE